MILGDEIVEAPPKRLKSSDQTVEEEKAPVESDGEDEDMESVGSDEEDEDISKYPSYILEKFPNLTVVEETPNKAPATRIISEEEKRLICPPENPRFQFCCFQVRYKNYGKRGKLFGSILASDRPGKLDRMSPDLSADCDYVTLFNRELCDSLEVHNLSFVYINPTCDRSIPASTYLEIFPELYLITEEDGKDNPNYIEVAKDFSVFNFINFWLTRCYEGCCSLILEGEHGSIKLYYIVIRHAVDAVVEVTFEAQPKLCLKPDYAMLIAAYYGPDFKIDNSDSVEKHCYKLILFDARPLVFLKTGKIPLLQSVVAVPAKSSLIIEAYVHDNRSMYTYMDDVHTFPAQLKDISDSTCIVGEDCRLHVTVNWKYELAT